MVFGKSRLELRVGIFVLAGLAIMMMFILRIGNTKLIPSSSTINFIFHFANGVKVGAPVRFAGVDIGEIKEVNLFFDSKEQKTKIQILGRVKKETKIPMDSTVWINTLGLLGEKYIEIMPGKDYARCVTTGGTMIGNDPLAMQEVSQPLIDIANKLNSKQGTLGKLLSDDAVYNNLEAFTNDIKKHPWKLLRKTSENR